MWRSQTLLLERLWGRNLRESCHLGNCTVACCVTSWNYPGENAVWGMPLEKYLIRLYATANGGGFWQFMPDKDLFFRASKGELPLAESWTTCKHLWTNDNLSQNALYIKERNLVFTPYSDFLILTSLQPNVVDLRYNIFKNMNSFRLNSIISKYWRFKPSGCKDTGITNLEFLPQTQFLTPCDSIFIWSLFRI